MFNQSPINCLMPNELLVGSASSSLRFPVTAGFNACAEDVVICRSLLYKRGE